ncbi:MAG: tRNA (adenosine(37)-N6)-threonylcarbamoyltransferase complex dimerization subunit type 1 TsaB [Sphingorhabdus sp.]
MRRLVIDTATRACSVALFEGEKCVAACHEIIGRGHAERLVPMIAELPDGGCAETISVNVGPGSFTGIRVGISAAKALAFAWTAQCSGYSTLPMLAAIARRHVGGLASPVDVAIHGGHGEVFFQSFDDRGNALSASKSLLPNAAAQISKAPIIAGDAAKALIELRDSGRAIDALSDASDWPLIAEFQPLTASAIYIRQPDAKLPTGL